MEKSVAVALFGLTLGAIGAPPGARAAYPDHSITIIHPYPAGSSADVSIRKIADAIEPILGQQIIVENKPGASGIPAVAQAAKAKPDGYTLVFGTEQTHGTNKFMFKTLPYDPIKDFTPVSELWESVMIETVNAKLPVSSISDLIAYAKAHPGLKFGSLGIGSTPHLGAVDFSNRYNLGMVHVAYSNGGEIMTDLSNGAISVVFMTYGAMKPLLDAGKIKVLAVGSQTRLKALPNVPTMIEAGVPNYSSISWDALFAPAGTPKADIDVLYKAIVKGMDTPEMHQYFEQNGAVVALKSPAEMTAFLPGAIDKLGKEVAESGAKVQ